jgi:hypothetical protein
MQELFPGTSDHAFTPQVNCLKLLMYPCTLLARAIKEADPVFVLTGWRMHDWGVIES